MSTKPKAYAYSRISSRAQLKGDGLRRQLAAALEWAENHPDVEFDPTFVDRGLSAAVGHHRETGKLGVLLGMIDAGTIRAPEGFSGHAERRRPQASPAEPNRIAKRAGLQLPDDRPRQR
ncbi:MAG: recombinase family protein [Alphaproteobacteria bacterium]|nr:recombinase family protein [Alphaproteobacteria bacterium]